MKLLGLRPPAASLRRPSAVAAGIGGPAFGPGLTVGPANLATAYNIPANAGYGGGGQRIGIIGGADFLDSDLQNFMNYFGVNRTGPTYHEPTSGGGYFDPYSSNADQSFEATLDVQTVAGLAPDAEIHFKSAPAPLTNNDFGIELAQLIEDDNVDVLTASFGGCEGSDTNFDNTVDHYGIEGSSQGISLMAASGDYGYEGCARQYNAGDVNMPASDPNWTAVGGTSPYTETFSTLGYGQEFVYQRGGGGRSHRFGKPPWQHSDVPGALRAVPDIAFAAGDQNNNYGLFLFYNGGTAGATGTSLSSPIWASIQAEINQQQGRRHGNASAGLYDNYYAYGYSFPSGISMFRDCTQGSNGAPAQPGWDFGCGIGSVNGEGLERTE